MSNQPNAQSTKKHWKDFFDYKYLGSQDLTPGEDLTVKIVKFNQEKHTVSKGEKKEFLVIYFHGFEKGMIFNKTNCRTVGYLLKSNYPEDWVGKSIALYIEDRVKNPNGGDPVEALRIREELPKESAAQKSARLTTEAALAVGKFLTDAISSEVISEDERKQMGGVLRTNWPKDAAWRKMIVDKHLADELTIEFLKNYLLEDATAA